MTNEQKWMEKFLKQYPEFEGRHIGFTLAADVLDLDTRQLVAHSDAEHDISNPGYVESEPMSWTIV